MQKSATATRSRRAGYSRWILLRITPGGTQGGFEGVSGAPACQTIEAAPSPSDHSQARSNDLPIASGCNEVCFGWLRATQIAQSHLSSGNCGVVAKQHEQPLLLSRSISAAGTRLQGSAICAARQRTSNDEMNDRHTAVTTLNGRIRGTMKYATIASYFGFDRYPS